MNLFVHQMKKIIANSYCLLGYILFLLLLNACQQKSGNDVPVYEQKITDTVRSVIRAGNKVRANNDFEGALVFYKNAIELAKSEKDNLGLVEAYRNYIFVNGAILNRKDSALKMLDEAVPFANKLGDDNTLCDMYGLKGVTYQAAGELNKAIEANKMALKYMDEDTAPDSLKNWPLYLNVADLYSQLGNQPLAIEYTNRYLQEYALKINDTNRIVSVHNNLSIYHTLNGDSIAADENARNAYRLDSLKNGGG